MSPINTESPLLVPESTASKEAQTNRVCFVKRQKAKLIQKTVVIAEAFLNHREAMHQMDLIIGRSNNQAKWETITTNMQNVDLVFCDFDTVKQQKEKSPEFTERYKYCSTIWLNKIFEDRVEYAGLGEDSYEYKCIVTGLGVIIVHEFAHMCLSWTGIVNLPKNVSQEVGYYYENKLFGRVVLVYGKKESRDSMWTKETEIVGLGGQMVVPPFRNCMMSATYLENLFSFCFGKLEKPFNTLEDIEFDDEQELPSNYYPLKQYSDEHYSNESDQQQDDNDSHGYPGTMKKCVVVEGKIEREGQVHRKSKMIHLNTDSD